MFHESLEHRRLLSVSFSGGILVVRGGAGDDVINVSTDSAGGRIVVQDNSSIRRFSTSDVILKAIDDAGLTVKDVDGFTTYSIDRNMPVDIARAIRPTPPTRPTSPRPEPSMAKGVVRPDFESLVGANWPAKLGVSAITMSSAKSTATGSPAAK